jgi:hypothetical protein
VTLVSPSVSLRSKGERRSALHASRLLFLSVLKTSIAPPARTTPHPLPTLTYLTALVLIVAAGSDPSPRWIEVLFACELVDLHPVVSFDLFRQRGRAGLSAP